MLIILLLIMNAIIGIVVDVSIIREEIWKDVHSYVPFPFMEYRTIKIAIISAMLIVGFFIGSFITLGLLITFILKHELKNIAQFVINADSMIIEEILR